jgi:hypothetical protein
MHKVDVLIVSYLDCKIGAKKIMCICSTNVIILRFNLGEIIANSSGY